MKENLRPPPRSRNPLPELASEEQAVIDGASMFLRCVMAWGTALLLAREQAGVLVPAADAFVGLVTKATAAKALSVSASTIDRFVREGAPSHTIGGRRRFDTAELIAWANARGQKPAKTKAVRDSVDVDGVLARSGLRAIGGGK